MDTDCGFKHQYATSCAGWRPLISVGWVLAAQSHFLILLRQEATDFKNNWPLGLRAVSHCLLSRNLISGIAN